MFSVPLESSQLPSVTVSTGTDSLSVVSSHSLGGIPSLVSVSAFVVDFTLWPFQVNDKEK